MCPRCSSAVGGQLLFCSSDVVYQIDTVPRLDAKRAPKLACCQSSSSTTKQVDAGPATVAKGPDHPAASFMPLNRNPSLLRFISLTLRECRLLA
ncbi:unnamed protein product [Prunus armeniaca]